MGLSVKNFTHAAAGNCSGICLVGIYVHSQLIFGADASHNITENKRATLGRDFNANNLLVLNAVFLGVLGGHMYMALCGNNALGQLNFTCGAYQLTYTRAFNIARFSYGRGNAYGACVCKRQLNLCFGAGRT